MTSKAPVQTQVVIFRNRFVTKHSDMEATKLSLVELDNLIATTKAGSKDRLPLLKFAKMGDTRTHGGTEFIKPKEGEKSFNGLRNNENVLAIFGTEMDYDRGDISFDTAVETMRKAKIKCILYTSSSNTEKAPRWRILAPASRELKPEQRFKLTARINGLFNGAFGDESFVLSQSFYFGQVHGKPPMQHVVLDQGRFIDQAKELPEIGKVGRRTVAPASGPLAHLAAWANDGGGDFEHIGFEAKLDLIGDHEGGHGFNSPITAAAAAFITEYGPDADHDVFKDTVRQRIKQAEKNKSRAHDKNMQRYVSDPFLDEVLGSATKKYGAAVKKKIVLENDGPTFRLTNINLPTVARKIVDHWVENDEQLYIRGPAIVDPVMSSRAGFHKSTTETMTFHETPAMAIYGKILDTVHLEQFNVTAKKWVEVPPPKNLYIYMHAMGSRLKLHRVRGVINSPTMRPDGSILDQAGFDESTGFYLSSSLKMPAIGATRKEAESALRRLKKLLINYPFVNEEARAVALAGMLSVVARGAFPRHPIFVTDSPKPGTGKSHLLDLISMIGQGQRMATVAFTNSEEENKKALDALLISGQQMICFDNCDGVFGGKALNMLVTSDEVNVRILGHTKAGPVNTTGASLFANGNNIQLRADIVRRCMTSRLDTNMENPYARRFDFDPVDVVSKNRGHYVADALTICRSYLIEENHPKLKPLAGFDEWTSIINGALVWLGCPDIVGVVEATTIADSSSAGTAEILEEIADVMGTNNFGVFRTRELFDLINPEPGEELKYHTLSTLLVGALGGRFKCTPQSVGEWLYTKLDRIEGAYRVRNKPTTHGAQWWIERRSQADQDKNLAVFKAEEKGLLGLRAPLTDAEKDELTKANISWGKTRKAWEAKADPKGPKPEEPEHIKRLRRRSTPTASTR